LLGVSIAPERKRPTKGVGWVCTRHGVRKHIGRSGKKQRGWRSSHALFERTSHALFATSLPSSSAWSSFTYLQCEHYARNRTMQQHRHAQRVARSVRESPPRCIKRRWRAALSDQRQHLRHHQPRRLLRSGTQTCKQLTCEPVSINPLRMTHVHTRAHALHLTDSSSRTFGASAAGPQMAKARDAQVGEVMPACVAPFALCRAALVRS